MENGERGMGTMMELVRHERTALAVIGGSALLGLGVLLWQRRQPPLTMVGAAASVPVVQWDGALRRSRQVDVNTASVAELEQLPQVGPSLAQRILAYRNAHGPFRNADELMDVPGIGPKTYEMLKDYVTTQ